MAQEQKAKATGRGKQDTVSDEPVAQDSSVSTETDDLLDEIDSVLEENSEEFVRQYIQKGGQ